MDILPSTGKNGWTKLECLKVEKGLLVYGWREWKSILRYSKFRKRKVGIRDVENIARHVVSGCIASCYTYSRTCTCTCSGQVTNFVACYIPTDSHICSVLSRTIGRDRVLGTCAAVCCRGSWCNMCPLLQKPLVKCKGGHKCHALHHSLQVHCAYQKA